MKANAIPSACNARMIPAVMLMFTEKFYLWQGPPGSDSMTRADVAMGCQPAGEVYGCSRSAVQAHRGSA
jgi:hypothetical protein